MLSLVRLALQTATWAVAAVWLSRTVPALFRLRAVPDLTKLPDSCAPVGSPSLTVIVPAKDEAGNIGPTLESLLRQDYAPLRIVAVDDRSTDGTGAVMDRLAAEFPDRLRVQHLVELPAGWAGKVHAMTVGAEAVESEYLLFTDGDIFFEPSALRRALTVAVQTQADHLVCLPTLRLRRWDEGILLGVFYTLSGLAVRPWKVPDPRAKRDAAGVGAFNLVRRTAFDRLGGFAAEPLAIVEDLRLGQRMKAAGMRSVVALGPGMVQVHWASGALGIVRGVTKNFFAVLQFRMEFVVGSVGFVLAMYCLPVAGLFVPWLRLPAVFGIVGLVLAFAGSGRRAGVPGWYGFLSPLGALGVAGALLWSAVVTLRQGGILWRGTFYPLKELRAANRSVASF